MPERPARLRLLGESYVAVTGAEAALWRGDLLVIEDAIDPDYRTFLFTTSTDPDVSLALMHLTGHHAGAVLHAFPAEASAPRARNLRLEWLRQNWARWFPAELPPDEPDMEPERIGWGTLAGARFYTRAPRRRKTNGGRSGGVVSS